MQEREMVKYGFIAGGMLLAAFTVFQVTSAMNNRSAALVNAAKMEQYGECLREKPFAVGYVHNNKESCKKAIYFFQ